MAKTPSYLTSDGLKHLQEEVAQLKMKLREVVDRIDKAKELGDLSENAEYHEAKEDYAFTQGRILEIEDALSRAALIETKPGGDRVVIGSTIKIKNDQGQEKKYQIVGSNEADPLKGLISNESPLARAFLGRSKGERAEVKTPGGVAAYTIEEIE